MNFFRNALRSGEGDNNETLPLQTKDGQDAADREKVGVAAPPKLPPRKPYSYQSIAAMSMEDGSSTGTVTMSSAYYRSPSSTTYLVLATLFSGFCLGFSVAFWFASSYYWQSEAGLRRLGCIRDETSDVSHEEEISTSISSSTSTVEKLVGGGFAGSLKSESDKMMLLLKKAGGIGVPASHHIFHQDEPWAQELMAPADDLDDGDDNIPSDQLLGKSLLDLVGSVSNGAEILSSTSSTTTSSSTTTVTRANVYMNHIEAYELLLDDDKRSGGLLGSPASIGPFASHYFLLNSGLDVQVNQAYCAAATSAAVLNSLRFMHPRSEVGVDIPIDSLFYPYSYATQIDLFGPCTTKNVVAKAGITAFDGWGNDSILSFPYGLNLEQTASLLRCHLNSTAGWTVTAQHLDETHLTLAKMRFDMKLALSDPGARLIVNYHRAAAGQVGSGHFSPVGAYHQGTDSFLILDVARYKYPPVWIAAEVLYHAMRTYDQCGEWDFPSAQEDLDDRLKVAKSEADVKEAKATLGCKKALRGYIIAKRG